MSGSTSRHGHVPVQGGRAFLEVRGSGPPVLLIHGLSAHRAVWRDVVPELEGRFTLLLPDLLGRGASDPAPESGFSLVEERRRLETLLDRVSAGEFGSVPTGGSLDPVLVVGHSQGAALACALAARRDSIRGLLLLAPVTPWTERPSALALLRPRLIRRVVAGIFTPLRRPLARRVLRRVYGSRHPVREEDVGRYAEPYADPRRAETLLATLADWRPAELDGHLPARPVEVRVLRGEEDPRIGRREAARLARRLDAEFRELPGVGHAVPEERPDLVCRELLALRDAIRE